jgi:hypothetical protein
MQAPALNRSEIESRLSIEFFLRSNDSNRSESTTSSPKSGERRPMVGSILVVNTTLGSSKLPLVVE